MKIIGELQGKHTQIDTRLKLWRIRRKNNFKRQKSTNKLGQQANMVGHACARTRKPCRRCSRCVCVCMWRRKSTGRATKSRKVYKLEQKHAKDNGSGSFGVKNLTKKPNQNRCSKKFGRGPKAHTHTHTQDYTETSHSYKITLTLKKHKHTHTWPVSATEKCWRWTKNQTKWMCIVTIKGAKVKQQTKTVHPKVGKINLNTMVSKMAGPRHKNDKLTANWFWWRF